MDTILILDFGGQTTQLIARRVRSFGVYTEIRPGDIRIEDIQIDRSDLKGIIFSGSPSSVYEEGAPAPDIRWYDLGLPILGICYGLQRTMYDNGGEVSKLHSVEYGRSRINYTENHPLLSEIPKGFLSWMSHGDSIKTIAPHFHLIADSENGLPAIISHDSKAIVGIQFHPEVTHCEYGSRILENFAVGMCGARSEWNMDIYLEQKADEIRRKVGDENVLLLISGGVDSSVVAALLLKILKPEQVHLLYIDTGMMRKNESSEVKTMLETLGARHLHLIDASDRFLTPLSGVSDPEIKRRIIGDTFITVQEQEVARLELTNYFLAQGTLYTDLIESGKGVGTKAHVIKSHHNVRSPLVEAKRAQGLIIEPLDCLYKDEVRALGRNLGVMESIISRHPFPGPGLAVRILSDITRDKCDILREADWIYISELKKRNLYHDIWQAFAVLLPVKSVGVTGDARGYRYVLALRAVVSHDGMTADVYPFPMKDLLEISALITNQVPQIGRVVYDVSSKPPATIEWE